MCINAVPPSALSWHHTKGPFPKDRPPALPPPCVCVLFSLPSELSSCLVWPPLPRAGSDRVAGPAHYSPLLFLFPAELWMPPSQPLLLRGWRDRGQVAITLFHSQGWRGEPLPQRWVGPGWAKFREEVIGWQQDPGRAKARHAGKEKKFFNGVTGDSPFRMLANGRHWLRANPQAGKEACVTPRE